MDNENLISLERGAIYITQNKDDAIRVVDGISLIYIVPYKNNTPGRRSLIFEAHAGDTFPAFAFQDSEYRPWRFCIATLDKAQLMLVPNASTKVLKSKFLKKANVKGFELEGYENALVNQYERNIVAEDAFIHKTTNEKSVTQETSFKLIYNVFSKKALSIKSEKSENLLYNAIADLCKKEHIEIAPLEKIQEGCGNNFTVSDIARISHFAYREIVLEDKWYKTDIGNVLVFDTDGIPYVCYKQSGNKYIAVNSKTGVRAKVDEKLSESFEVKGFMLYRPFPNKKLSLLDLVKYCVLSLKFSDIAIFLVLSLGMTLISSLIPTLTEQIYNNYIPVGNSLLLFQMCGMIGSFMIANVMFSIVKGLVNYRFNSKIMLDIQHATYERVFNLPEGTLRQFESADLAQRVSSVQELANRAITIFSSSLLIVINFVVFFSRMMSYSGQLTSVAIIQLAIYGVFTWILSQCCERSLEKSAELEGIASSKLYQLLSGISKIRIAGVEDRALLEYVKPMTLGRKIQLKYGTAKLFGESIDVVIETVFAIVLYLALMNGDSSTSMQMGTFIAFNSAFGAFSGVFLQAFDNLTAINELRPLYKRVKPIFTNCPECNNDTQLPGELTGNIELSNLTFSYDKESDPVISNVSLKFNAGEYVGIVGPSGCGKSTLFKLMLGFEKPTSGKIFYDNKDIESIDKRELRKKFGVVLQDGHLISGSINENIAITSPGISPERIKEVVRDVGLENDIKDMPMGLHTVLSEDCGTISGGQQQRILIARAIVNNPKILFFDEATSALDNITQAKVCETLEKMGSTRIVIAHRLSTIMTCDRIIVMNAGRIEEQGTYEDLMKKKGLFYELASRQIV